MSVPRRRFLLSAGSVLALAGAPGCSVSRNPYRLLDTRQAGILAAICEQIIPTDETPGAAWANVVKFIDRQLVYHYQQFRQPYREGLAALERASLTVHRLSFDALPFDTQTDLIAQMEKGEIGIADWPPSAQRDFFRTVRTHTMQGYYGDPRHGGNRDMVAWRTLGVPHPPIRGRDDYRFPKNAPSEAAVVPAYSGEARR